jgi:heat-inducible transcriptional repressor
MALHELTERERLVLEAVIQMYVETAEPAGSRALSRRSGLGVSPATIRNTMSDLEEKGFLFHPHTSAGRVPTDKAYRVYVDALMAPAAVAESDYRRLAEEISAGSAAVEAILRRAAQSLGLLTQELGLALGPQVDRTVLQRVELVRLASDRVLVVLTLKGGAVRTIFVEARGEIADRVVAEVAMLLNERLAGLTLPEIRATLAERLRDGAERSAGAADLLNIFVEEREQLFDGSFGADDAVVLGQPSVLADQPEFADGAHLRRLLDLTGARQPLGDVLRRRAEAASTVSPGITITIGNEHSDPRLDRFTLVTGEYHAGPCTGLIGVIGPTRMPYEKIVAMVSHASRLLTELLD